MRIKLRVGLLLLMLLVAAAVAHAQQREKLFGILEDSYGIKGGVNASTIIGSHVSGQVFNTGFNLSIFYNKILKNNIALQPEITYKKIGGEGRVRNNAIGLLIQNYTLSYLEFPLLVKYVRSNSGGSRLNFFIGPSLGWLVDQETVNQREDISSTEHTIFDNFNWSLIAGGGLDARYGNKLVIMEIQAGYGLNSFDSSGADIDIHNFYIGANFGFAFQ